MDEETKKIFSKEFSILETKKSLIKEPKRLNGSCAPLGIGLPDIYKKIENERCSSIKVEDIQHRIDILKTQENVDQEQIEVLEQMKTASQLQTRADLNPMEEINEFKSAQDLVRAELESIGKSAEQTLTHESIVTIKKQIDSDPLQFRSKYPELFDYMTSHKK